MRVDLLIDNLGSGGAQRQLVELACALRRRGVEARIVAYRAVSSGDVDLYGRRIARAGLPVSIVAKRRKLDPGHPSRLARALAGADLVQSYMPIPSIWVCAALSRMPRAERPRWIACERTDPASSSWSEGAVRAFAFRRADAVTTNSRGALDVLAARYGIPRTRLHYIPNGIDLARWDEAAARPLPWPMAADRFHVVVVGRLSREKSHALLLEAIARLDSRLRASWTVWFLGADARGSRGERAVRDAIARFGLERIVEIRPPTPEVATVLAHADLLVLPSRFEGFPNAVLEGMASRAAVVAAPVGDVPELVEQGRTGFLFRADDTEDLALQLTRVHAMPRKARRAIGEAARRRVEAQFRIEKIAARYHALYDRLLQRKRAPAPP